MLQSSILAPGDEAITVEVLDVEHLLDGVQAGVSVLLVLQDWEDGSIGRFRDDILLEVASELVVEAEEDECKDVSADRDGGQGDITVEGDASMVADIEVGAGSVGVSNTIFLVYALIVGGVIVLIEPVDELVSSVAEREAGDDDAEAGDHHKCESFDGLVPCEGSLNAQAGLLGFCQSLIHQGPHVCCRPNAEECDNQGPDLPQYYYHYLIQSEELTEDGFGSVNRIESLAEADARLD